jgi:hypothetical protein
MGQFTDLLEGDGFDAGADAEAPWSEDWAVGLASKAEFKSISRPSWLCSMAR